LWHRIEFVLTLWWQRLRFAPALVRRHLWFALILLRQSFRWRFVYALAFSWQSLDFARDHILRPGHQRLGLSGDSFFSLASEFDASGSLGQGWCSIHDQQRTLSSLRVNARGVVFPRTRILGCAGKSDSFPESCQSIRSDEQ
jgi:hypothetical protein